MKHQTCYFTVHRKIPPEQYDDIAERLRENIIQLIGEGVRYFGAGGALGYDTMAAQAILLLKPKFPQIKLILVLPCQNQTRGWTEKDIQIYEDIKANCDKFLYTSQEYSRGCMQKRNRHLVNHSSVCICYLTEQSGGTTYTVNYAKSRGLRIINVAD
ncbi:MAG: SLOG family protein [Oscillospiraceae bacterium]|nr:SLOG family protein [Oscillospiraceae bacterium]MDD4413462.1 SLOG family protein [Oscillospiraceae bacterium]